MNRAPRRDQGYGAPQVLVLRPSTQELAFQLPLSGLFSYRNNATAKVLEGSQQCEGGPKAVEGDRASLERI